MARQILIVCACVLMGVAPALGQSTTSSTQITPPNLATLFEDIYGPNGLVVSSDQVFLDGSTHAAHFNSAFQADFRLMNIAVAEQLTALPLPSPAGGFTYTFDRSTGTFVRSTNSFGPILSDRGETIGRHKIAFGTNYQFFSFNNLDGVSLSDVPAVFRHDDYKSTPGRSDVIATDNSIQASVMQFTGAVTFGLTDRIDISAAVPIIRTRIAVISNATIERQGTAPDTSIHYFYDPAAIGNHGTAHQFEADGEAGGVGDVVVRLKANAIRQGNKAIAVGLDARLPTGDELNLLGSGAYGVRPFAVVSGSWGVLSPHANVSYQWNGKSVLAGDVRTGTKADMPDQFQFAAGTDVTVTPRLNLVFDVFGERLVNTPRLSVFPFDATGPAGSVELRDLQFQTASFWTSSGSIGFKTNVAPRLLLNFNLRFAVSHNGLTDRVTPLLGMEWAF